MKILSVIPARGGSKGIKHKNLQEISGKPLIVHTIEASRSSKLVNRTVVSTDDPKIADVAKKHNADVPFMRPSEYATDTAKSIDVALHALAKCSAIFGECYDLLVLLQPTSPFRKAKHIDEALLLLMEDSNADSLISVREVANDCHPHYVYSINESNRCSPFIGSTAIRRRQDLPSAFVRNGAIYAVKSKYLQQHRRLISEYNIAYRMTNEDSINIDTELDLTLARSLVSKKVKR